MIELESKDSKLKIQNELQLGREDDDGGQPQDEDMDDWSPRDDYDHYPEDNEIDDEGYID